MSFGLSPYLLRLSRFMICNSSWPSLRDISCNDVLIDPKRSELKEKEREERA